MSDYQHWYYINKNYEEDGPVSSDELNEMVITGDIHRGTYVWTQELEEWVPASKVGGLFPDKQPNPAPKASGSIVQTTQPTPATVQPSQPKLALKELVPVSKATPKKKSSQPSKATPISQATPIAPASPVTPNRPVTNSPTSPIGLPVIPPSTSTHIQQQPTSPTLTTGGIPVPIPHHGSPAPATAPQRLAPTPLSSPQSLAVPLAGTSQPTQQASITHAPSAAGANSIPIPGHTTSVQGLPSIPAIGSNPVQTQAPSSPPLPKAPATPPKPMSKPTPMRPS